MRKLIILLCISAHTGQSYCQLIRPNVIYESVIKGVHDYYNNTCIILLHATEDPIESQEESENLQRLQAYLSKAYIRTAVMQISTFIDRVGGSYYHIKRPLFVLLNDDDDVRNQFAFEIAPWIDMSYPNWLVFLRPETSIEGFFDKIYVQFDCTMMVSQPDGNLESPGEIITEVYQIDRGEKLRTGLFATWSRETGIKLPRWSLYQRRSDLQGHLFRVMSIEDPPQSMIRRDDNGQVTGLGGFFGGLMDLLQESMNCTLVYLETNEWGYLRGNGTWTGAVGSLIDNTSDIVAAELIMTRDRVDAIKFTTPVYSTKIRTYIKRPSLSALKWGAYFIPFEPSVWVAIVVMIVITTATISLVNSAISLFARQWKDNDDCPTNVPDIFFAVFGVFCSQGMSASILDPIRISHFVIHLTGVIILAAYSAALISALAVKTFVLPFTTMDGLLKDNTYRFGVVRDSADYSFFQNTTDEILGVLFDKLLVKEKELPNNYLEGLSLVCNEDKYAFMTVDNAVTQLQSEVGCVLVPLDTISQTSIAFGLRPGSPYRGILDSHLLLLRDSGVMQRLLNSHWAMTGDNVEGGWESVEIGDILPLAVMLLTGIFMGFMILSIEKLVKRNAKIIKKEKKIVKKFLKNAKFLSGQLNHVKKSNK
ncbi:probable glutamate receptor [Diachasma alloeum]|uniref:Ionotropic receptor 119 n=1 Tax=Diachasma alloeum TaxID=454923 RepID=A0A4E0RYV5_9HYME|nr:probable glutamate receptor [Diachasma alloeum]THK32961.1 ionotropic receptor 119 [Diachasma alloeum]